MPPFPNPLNWITTEDIPEPIEESYTSMEYPGYVGPFPIPSDLEVEVTCASVYCSGTHYYRCLFYSVRFSHGGVEYETWMRIHLPNLSRWTSSSTSVGVVLFVDGGMGTEYVDLPEEVFDQATADPNFKPAALLASGLPMNGTSSAYQMYTVDFTKPGCGGAMKSFLGEYFDAHKGYYATGDASLPVTPQNTKQADYCGPLTRVAMDAVMIAAATLIQEHERLYGFDREKKLILSSYSNGLAAASHWMLEHATILDRLYTFHALVDIEGPSDSFEQCGAASAFNTAHPYSGGDFATWLSTAFTYEEWFAWLLTTPVADYWMHPPRAENISGGFPADMSVTRSEWALMVRDAGKSTAWWTQWQAVCAYHGGSSDEAAPVAADLDSFYDAREPILALPGLVEAGIGYIRIQGAGDHAQPVDLKNRHAIKNLNAAYSGGKDIVYYVDSTHLLLDPELYDGTCVDTDPSGTTAGASVWPTWPDYEAAPLSAVDEAGDPQEVFLHHVRTQVIRWAFNQDFA